ncbi:UNVERIFIED_CONTAM: protein DOWNY MILDEW RESISTANCE 6 [Sesamum latifolium]|uniref:Protein DOWNY MILDEW RESISTANCE 6 n=1 Tax=Sesamum latifolium TaxID=2727402 RepID=A0AAW2U7Z9_9LAMI
MSYIRPKFDRPKLFEVVDCNNIPVIDLACRDMSLIVKQIGNACREYGFFQVINHGVSKEAMYKILGVAHEFFGLPVEEKMKLDDPTVDKFQCEEGDCEQLEGLSEAALLSLGQICA